MNDWQPAASAPHGVVLDTKIDDADGVRNEQRLRRRDHLWWTPDDRMYVYYRPTHWRWPVEEATDAP